MTVAQDLKPEGANPPAETSKKARPKLRLPTPEALADVALIDATTCAAAGCMGVSWWHDMVRAGRAPAPVIREPRCTRWRLADVRAFYIARSEQAASNAQAGEVLKARATKASHKARANRAAASQVAG